MLKHRQDGLVGLHGSILLTLVTAAFPALLFVVEAQKLITFNVEVNWGLYMVGVFGAMAWVHYSLRGAGERLGALTWPEALRLTAQQVMRLMVVLFSLSFVTKDVEISRIFLAGFICLASGILFAANFFLAPWVAKFFFQRQRLRTIIVAQAAEAKSLEAWLAPRGYLGIETIGYVTPGPREKSDNASRLGSIDDLVDLIDEKSADQVVFAQADYTREGIPDLVRSAEQAHCRVRFFLDMKAVFASEANLIEHNENYAFATSSIEPLENPFNRVLKRALDIAVALPIVLFVLPPLTVLVWIMQRIQSPGPVFYGQPRSGLNRERFYIYKFRTMHVHDGSSRARQATANDDRVYPFARFLRRSSLDEIPQFLNVILGAMSVSGPRPHLIEHDEKFSRIEHAYFRRHFVKPGITGLAQSKGFRGELLQSGDLANRVHYDAIYVANWSLALDIRILFDTARQVISPPRSAY